MMKVIALVLATPALSFTVSPLVKLQSIGSSLFSATSSIPESSRITVSSVFARTVLDSRGNPTVEVDLTDSNGSLFRASVPSGASTGAYEAYELRDGGSLYGGKGVLKACANVNGPLNDAISSKSLDVRDQQGIDDLMISIDGTENKQNMGANALLGISLAVSKAGAAASKLPLYKYYAKLAGAEVKTTVMPVPCFNVINGGSHAGNKLAFQEYFVIPTGASSFKEALRIGTEVSVKL